MQKYLADFRQFSYITGYFSRTIPCYVKKTPRSQTCSENRLVDEEETIWKLTTLKSRLPTTLYVQNIVMHEAFSKEESVQAVILDSLNTSRSLVLQKISRDQLRHSERGAKRKTGVERQGGNILDMKHIGKTHSDDAIDQNSRSNIAQFFFFLIIIV